MINLFGYSIRLGRVVMKNLKLFNCQSVVGAKVLKARIVSSLGSGLKNEGCSPRCEFYTSPTRSVAAEDCLERGL